jgi:hypothetical protein
MARQGGQVQLEQSDMRLALNMAKMAKESFSCAAIKQMKFLITKPRAEVREEKQRGAEVPGHKGGRLRYKDTRQCFVKTKHPAAFLAKMAPQSLRRHG